MKFLRQICVCISVLVALTAKEVLSACDADNCKRENNCACPSTQSPLSNADTPQFVTLSFDDAISDRLNRIYLSTLFPNRQNPDSTPITATFYIPHPYSDYRVINALYNQGHEIGLNSVSKGGVDYWKTRTETELEQEFGDNRQIITTFANVPSTDILGARTPNLEVSGDNSFTAYTNLGIQYDNTCVVRSSNPLYPFTLEVPSDVECLVGTYPSQSFPGTWALPIITFLGKDDMLCNSLAGCQISGTADEISEWLKREFNRIYTTNKAPITLMVSSMWFEVTPNSFEALGKFLDYLGTLTDVYLVSHQEVIRWAMNPVALSSYVTGYQQRSAACTTPTICFLRFNEQERVLPICGACPAEYPWLGNPEGGW